jgi:hypothetical protein
MSSTSINKKEIVDFLWEWTENKGIWAELLVNKIVSTENELSSTERETIFNYFLQSIGLFSGLPAIEITKPNYTPTNQEVKLVSLSDVLGVNRLAKNQTINFSPNLTVVFGENGTGKTGYGRILKTLGFSYDTHNNILSDITKTSEAQSAVINYNANSVAKTFPPLTRESFRVVNVIKYQLDACTNLGNGEKCATFTFFFRNNFYL